MGQVRSPNSMSSMPVFCDPVFKSDPTSDFINLQYGTINGPKHTSNHRKTLIESPNYPKPYPDNVVCRWNITVPCGSYISTEELPGIRIIFDSFQLRTTTDHLDIKENGRVVKTMQGYDKPEPFISKQKTVE